MPTPSLPPISSPPFHPHIFSHHFPASLLQLCIFYEEDRLYSDQATIKRNKKMSGDKIVGTWGGNGGSMWDDGEYTGVRQIIIYHSLCIDSLTLVYDDNGKRVVSPKHGGDGGVKTEIKLDYPEEFLVSVRGHYKLFNSITPVIGSLEFTSNIRTYGPYGREEGTPFLLPNEGRQIAGFKGRSGAYLDAIGFYLTSYPTKPGRGIMWSHIIVEPRGGKGGSMWDDGEYTGVKQIIIYHGLCIDSISLVYDDNGKRVVSPKHGGGGGKRTEIILDYPEEFLVGVSGHYSPFHTITPVIRSLTFRSNQRIFGPYGIEEGKPFLLPNEEGQIAGFKGRSGIYLDAIGFYLTSVPTKPGRGQMSSHIIVEPWGGNGGSMWDDGQYTGVKQIIIYHNLCINSISLVYDDNGERVVSPKHGGDGGGKTEIKLDYPEEFLVGVRGHYKLFNSITPVIWSLEFESNLRTYGPYGTEEGTPFILPNEGRQIAGFKGRSGAYLDAIGFYLTSYPTKPERGTMSSHIIVEPWGGKGGSMWDDGQYTGVIQIIIHHNVCIDSISLVYDDNGKRVVSPKHGGDGGEKTEIKLDYPEEFLIGVSGHYSPYYTITPVIRSLMFRSNRRIFGPYGIEEGTPFTLAKEGSQIAGFKGRCDLFVDSIGFYLTSDRIKLTRKRAHGNSAWSTSDC